ncbi:hypothetical protein CsatB_003324 [Cannabis sativa]
MENKTLAGDYKLKQHSLFKLFTPNNKRFKLIISMESRVIGGTTSGSNPRAGLVVPTASGHAQQTMLNPCAEEWDPQTNRAPEEERCLYLTFSSGYPLSPYHIKSFFNRKFGCSCVYKVYVYKPERKEEPPLFGKVIFKKSSIPAMVMGNRNQVKFVVDNKPLRCKRFHDRGSSARCNNNNIDDDDDNINNKNNNNNNN